MTRTAAIAVLLALGLLSYFAGKEDSADFAFLLAFVCTALAFAVAHPSGVANALALKRMPSIRASAGATAVFVVASWLLLGAVEVAFQGPISSGLAPRDRLAEQIARYGSFAWLLVAIAPLLLQIARADREASFGSAGAGLGGGLLMGFGLLVAWAGFGEHAITSALSDNARTTLSAIFLPVAGLFTGLGFGLWRSGLRPDPWRLAGHRDVFACAFSTAAAGQGVACILSAGAGAAELFRAYPTEGVVAGAVLCAGIGVAWIVIFLDLSALAPATVWRGFAAFAIAVIAVPVSFLVPGMIAEARDWSGLVIIVAGPIALCVAASVLPASFFGIRSILGRAEPMSQSS